MVRQSPVDLWRKLPRPVDFVLTLVAAVALLAISASLLQSVWADWHEQRVHWKEVEFTRGGSSGSYWWHLSIRLVTGVVTAVFWIWCLVRMPRRIED
jgi:hypothetical protein